MSEQSNLTSLLAQGAKALNLDQNKVNQAAKKAAPYLSKVSSKEGALAAIREVGMPPEFIDKALSVMDSPKAKKVAYIARFAGIDVQACREQVESLKQPDSGSTGFQYQSTRPVPRAATPSTSTSTSKASDPLESLKSGLPKRR